MRQQETRVGYMTLDILTNMMEDYIKVHTVDKKYIGEYFILDNYQKLIDYLNVGNTPNKKC